MPHTCNAFINVPLHIPLATSCQTRVRQGADLTNKNVNCPSYSRADAVIKSVERRLETTGDLYLEVIKLLIPIAVEGGVV